MAGPIRFVLALILLLGVAGAPFPSPVIAQAAQHEGAEPVAPFAIGQGVYYVGARDVTSFLIVTREGMILIDGGYAEMAPQILANIRALGFDPRRVRILLNSHAHFDHAGGLAALQRATGARVYASRADGELIQRGGRGDFALGSAYRFAPVRIDRWIADGERVTLGGVTLTAHITAGHTRGCTSLSFPATIAGQVRQAIDVCSLSILPSYRLTGRNPSYPGIADDYRRSIATLRALPCDVPLGSHGVFFRLTAKRAALAAGHADAFVDPEGCRRYLDRSEAALNARLRG
jgi:metallo-beta-lactamase class B